MLKAYFACCEERFPGQRAQLRQISLALRRAQIDTMEQLCRLCRNEPGTLTAMRSIGTKRLKLIEQVCRQYETDFPPAVKSRTERLEGIP